MSIDVKVRESGVEQVKSKVEGLGRTTKKAATEMETGFKKVNRALGALGIAGSLASVGVAFRAAARSVLEFETAMAEVSTLVDTTTTDMSALTKEVLNLTLDVPRDATDVSRGLYQVISAGVTDAAEAMDVLEVATKAAVGGITDTKTSVDALTTVLNAFGKETDEADDVADIFFTTIKEGKTTFTELAGGIGVVASSAALAGVTFAELGAALATLTKAGISTDIGVTALNRLFLSMANPTAQLKETTKALGVEFSAAALRSKGFARFIRELTVAFQDDQDAIFQLGLDVRAFRALSVLGGTGSAEFAKQLDNMGDAAGSAEEAFEKMNKTGESTWQLFKNQLNKTTQSAGEKTIPLVSTALRVLTFELRVLDAIVSEGPVDSLIQLFREAKEAAPSMRIVSTSLSDAFEKLAGTGKDVGEVIERDWIPNIQIAGDKFSGVIQPTTESIISSTDEIAQNIMTTTTQLGLGAKAVFEVDQKMALTANNTEDFAEESKKAAIAWAGIGFSVGQVLKDLTSGKFRLSSLLQVASFIPGPHQPFTAAAAAGTRVLGFQGGGEFTVGGRGGPDSQLVQFAASPGERVTVQTPQQVTNNNGVTIIAPELQSIDDDFIWETKIMPRIRRSL